MVTGIKAQFWVTIDSSCVPDSELWLTFPVGVEFLDIEKRNHTTQIDATSGISPCSSFRSPLQFARLGRCCNAGTSKVGTARNMNLSKSGTVNAA